MSYESNIDAQIEALEIRYFLDDPDDAPDRYGDGYYFRKPGRASWSGPWLDADECREMHRDELEAYYESLERKMRVYGHAPSPEKKRYLLEFDGILDPIAFDVRFFLWYVGPGNPPRMKAVIDARGPAEIPALLDGTVLTYGEIKISEITGTITEICRAFGFKDPAEGPN